MTEHTRGLWRVAHDAVVGAPGSRAAGAGAVAAQHLRRGPAVQLHQVAFGAAAVQPGVAEVVPEPVWVHLHPALPAAAYDHLVDALRRHRPAVIDPQPQLRPPGLGVPGTHPDVAVHGPGGRVADLHDALPAALASHRNLPRPQVQVATLRILRVVADARQL